MKIRPIRTLLASFCFLSVAQQNFLFAEKIQGPYPSRSELGTNRFSESAGIIIHEVSDFRLLHCDVATLMRRVQNSVCIFDLAGITLSPDQRGVDSKEVKVGGDSMAMKELLGAVGMGTWKGGQPQIKLVSRNSIIQSPLARVPESPKQLEEFLNARVFAGDFVVVARMQ